jgi:predicted Rossmann fold flavoprotein
VSIGQNKIQSNWVLLATGGKSYPTTGSTGDGYVLAERLGHRIIPPVGSLVPLEAEEDCAIMQGLSLRNVGVRLVDQNEKLLFSDFGELLFTHFGISGPTVLSASAHLPESPCKILIDLKPGLDEGKLNERILRDLQMYRNRSMENALTDLLPRSMIPVVLKRLGIDPAMQANALNKQIRRSLVDLLKTFPITIYAKRPVEEAIITSGGVDVGQINPKTMESKLISGLYFAGEVIDCDAYTGGFNLQIAWSTAYAAAMAVCENSCNGGM